MKKRLTLALFAIGLTIATGSLCAEEVNSAPKARCLTFLHFRSAGFRSRL